MLANFLNKSKPINFIGLLVFFFISYVYIFFTENFEAAFSISIVSELLWNLLLFLLIFFFLNFIISKNNLTFDNSYGFFVFVLLSTCCLTTLLESSNILLLLIQILFFRKIYSLQSEQRLLQKLFDSGFWLGVFLIFSSDALLFFILLYAALLIHQKISIQTLFTPLFGFASPLIIYFTYLYWIDEFESLSSFFKLHVQDTTELGFENNIYVLLYVLAPLTFIAFIVKSIKTIPISNKFRASWFVLSVHLILSSVLFLFINGKASNSLVYLLFPTTIILANGIELVQNKYAKNIILYMMLVGSFTFLYFL